MGFEKREEIERHKKEGRKDGRQRRRGGGGLKRMHEVKMV